MLEAYKQTSSRGHAYYSPVPIYIHIYIYIIIILYIYIIYTLWHYHIYVYMYILEAYKQTSSHIIIYIIIYCVYISGQIIIIH